MQHPNPYVKCPYNSAHQVPKLRLQHHLVKCRKSHQGALKEICPFNATHIMPTADYEDHIQNCPDKRLIEGQKYNATVVEDHGYFGNPSFHHNVPFEKWDDVNGENGVIESNHVEIREPGEEPLRTQPLRRIRDYDNPALQPLRLPRQPPLLARKTRESQVKKPILKDWMGMGRGSVHRILAAAGMSEF